MGKFQQWLREALEGVKEAHLKAHAPKDELEEGEKVLIRLADHDIRKLFVLCDLVSEELTESRRGLAHAVIDLDDPRKAAKDKGVNRLDAQRHLLEARYEALSALFWAEVKHELTDQQMQQLSESRDGISIKRNWEIVSSPQSSRPRLEDVAIHISFGR